jgi:hypothetical protein
MRVENTSAVKKTDSVPILDEPLAQFEILRKSFMVLVLSEYIMLDQRGQIADAAVRS